MMERFGSSQSGMPVARALLLGRAFPRAGVSPGG